jgi:hypothetical protein
LAAHGEKDLLIIAFAVKPAIRPHVVTESPPHTQAGGHKILRIPGYEQLRG